MTEILNARGRRLANYMMRKPITGHIRTDKHDHWKHFKQICKENRIQVNPFGFEHMIEINNMISEVLFPIADQSGIDPLEFTKKRVEFLLEEVKNNKSWKKDTEVFHDKICKETDHALTVNVKVQ